MKGGQRMFQQMYSTNKPLKCLSMSQTDDSLKKFDKDSIESGLVS